MDAIFVNLFGIILSLTLLTRLKSTILYSNKRNEWRSANRKGDTP